MKFPGVIFALATRPLVFLLVTCHGLAAREISVDSGRVGLTFLPEWGGRLTSVSFKNSPNLLAVDLGQMPKIDASIPMLRRATDSGGGMTVWLAPQSEWWAHQSVHPSRFARRADWPPDPFGEAVPFSVEWPGPAAICLVGPESPVTGMRLSKKARLEDDAVIWEFEALNVLSASRAWGLWPNIRVPIFSEVFVESSPPLRGAARPWMRHSGQWTTISGPAIPESPGEKVGVPDWTGRAAVVQSGVVWMIFVETPERVAPGHARLEIFVNAGLGDGRCMEVEPMGAYQETQPGEAVAMRMIWRFQILPDDLKTPDDRLAFIRQLMDQ